MTSQLENLCSKKCTHSINVESSARACINCLWYEQYYRPNRGNIRGWVPTCTGFCLLHDRQRGPLRQPCKSFERKENAPPGVKGT